MKLELQPMELFFSKKRAQMRQILWNIRKNDVKWGCFLQIGTKPEKEGAKSNDFDTNGYNKR